LNDYSFFSAPQLKRDSLGSPVTWLQLGELILLLAPIVAVMYWYKGRVRHVNQAQRDLNRTIFDVWHHPTPLELQVTRQGWLVLAGVLAYWLLMSLIF